MTVCDFWAVIKGADASAIVSENACPGETVTLPWTPDREQGSWPSPAWQPWEGASLEGKPLACGKPLGDAAPAGIWLGPLGRTWSQNLPCPAKPLPNFWPQKH